METDFSAKDDPITFLNNIKTNKITIKGATLRKKLLINI